MASTITAQTFIEKVNHWFSENFNDDAPDMDELKEEFEALVDKLNQKKKKKPKRDPDSPKKPPSTYNLFSADAREEIKKDNAAEQDDDNKIKGKDIMSEIGKRWGVFKESKKSADTRKMKSYIKIAEEKKEEYKVLKAEYDLKHGIVDKKKKASASPKKPPTAYILFCKPERENIKKENPDMKGHDITRELSRRWATLKEDKEAHEAIKAKATKLKDEFNDKKDEEKEEEKDDEDSDEEEEEEDDDEVEQEAEDSDSDSDEEDSDADDAEIEDSDSDEEDEKDDDPDYDPDDE